MSSQPAQSDQTSCQTASTPVPTAHVPTEGLVSPDRVPVRRALVSVYDKTGLVPLARALADAGVELVSTGSTADHHRRRGPGRHPSGGGHRLPRVP